MEGRGGPGFGNQPPQDQFGQYPDQGNSYGNNFPPIAFNAPPTGFNQNQNQFAPLGGFVGNDQSQWRGPNPNQQSQFRAPGGFQSQSSFNQGAARQQGPRNDMRAQGNANRNQGQNHPQNQQAQRTNSSGSSGNNSVARTGAEPEGASGNRAGEHVESDVTKPILCFRCGEPGHVLKECKTKIFCINCGKHNVHISGRCGMLNGPLPVLKLVGCGANGLQLLQAQSGVRSDGGKNALPIGIVNVLEGEISSDQLTAAFKAQFPWGGEWKIKGLRDRKFLAKFPNAARLQEMSEYPQFGLKGTRTIIKVSKWTEASGAKFKLYSVWVKITGVPDSLQHRNGFAEIASMLGTVQEIDMEGFWNTEVVRVKVGVRNPRKIPEVAELTVDPFIYYIYFDLEKIVEQGGYLQDGVVIRGHEQQSRQDGGRGNEKRFRDLTAGEGVGHGSGSSMDTDSNSNAQDVQGDGSQTESDLAKEVRLRTIMLAKQMEADKKANEDDGIGMEDLNNGDGNDETMAEMPARIDTDEQEKLEEEAENIQSTQAMRERIEKEYGLHDEEEVPDSQEDFTSDKILEASSALLRGDGSSKADSGRESAIDEQRRRTSRNVGDKHIMDKAKDRAMMKNLEMPENKRSTGTGYRCSSSVPGGV